MVVVVYTAGIIALSAAMVAVRSRKGGTRASVVGSGVSGAVLITLATVPMPIVGWAFPSPWQLAFFFVGFQLLGAAVALAGKSPPGRAWPAIAIAIALVAIASLGWGIARSRGKIDELALRYGSSCVRGQFYDAESVFDFRFFSSPYEVRTTVVDHGELDCALEVAGKSVPVYSGRTYGGTPLCTTGEVIVCGKEGILLVEDSTVEMYFGDSRFRGFRLPNLEPFAPKQNMLATPIPLEIMAAIASILVAVNWRRRSFAASAMLVAPLVAWLSGTGVFL